MNPPSRCEPLPFLRATGEAAPAAPSCTDESTTAFTDLLQDKLTESPGSEHQSEEDPKLKSKKEKDKGEDALAAYGVATILLQLSATPQPALPNESTTNAAGSPELASGEISLTASAPEGLDLEETDSDPKNQSATPKPAPSEAALQAGASSLAKELDRLPLNEAQQKVPVVARDPTETGEETARKGPEPAKKFNGMVAAQRPPMLMRSNDHDQKAPREEHRLAVDHFEAAKFEQPIQEAAPRAKNSGSDIPDFDGAALKGDFAPKPQVEMLSGETEIQPAKSVEPSHVIEGIRSHAEILKSSTSQKLDVVLRPDAQTELRLRVEKVDGQVQVQVRCDRGDFAGLGAHWNNIQNSLAAQGIRVEPLQPANTAHFHQGSSSHSQQFAEHQSQSGARDERRPAFLEQDFPIRRTPQARTSRGTAARGWQSWA